LFYVLSGGVNETRGDGVLDYSLMPAYLMVAATRVLIPGADTLLVASVATQKGPLAGACAALGAGTSSLFYGVLTAFGMGALIVSSPIIFTALLLAGAIYLFYLGLGFLARALQKPAAELRPAKLAMSKGAFHSFRSGVLVNFLNPKIVLFYLALLPPFVSVDLGNPSLQVFLLSCILNAMGTTYLLGVSLASGMIGRAVSSPIMERILNALAGGMFMGLSIRAFYYATAGS
jgi:threonine/homoserine/homoserine lactone efflux protein